MRASARVQLCISEIGCEVAAAAAGRGATTTAESGKAGASCCCLGLWCRRRSASKQLADRPATFTDDRWLFTTSRRSDGCSRTSGRGTYTARLPALNYCCRLHFQFSLLEHSLPFFQHFSVLQLLPCNVSSVLSFYLRCMLFTTRRYASVVYAVVVCPSVRPSVRPFVCLSHAGIGLKRLNLGSRKKRHTIALMGL